MKKTILFLCTGNSCRSQMAEGWAKALKGDVFDVYSAGIETHGLNPHAVAVMQEAGIDISQHTSKTLEQLPLKWFDYVVTVCDHARESCPVFLKAEHKLHKSFPDPPKLAELAEGAEAKLDCYRRVRDEIKMFIEALSPEEN